jgi:hypothetical protein
LYAKFDNSATLYYGGEDQTLSGNFFFAETTTPSAVN